MGLFSIKVAKFMYYMHRMVSTVIKYTGLNQIIEFSEGTFIYCIVLFFVCMVIALLFRNMPIKWVRDSFM